MKLELSTKTVNELIEKIDRIFKEYDISDFQKVSIFETMKFEMYLSNIKKLRGI